MSSVPPRPPHGSAAPVRHGSTAAEEADAVAETAPAAARPMGSAGVPVGAVGPGGRAGLVPCPRCGALNGSDFASCVRCARPLPSAQRANADADTVATGGRPSQEADDHGAPRLARASTKDEAGLRRPGSPSAGSGVASRLLLRAAELPATSLLLALTALVFVAQLAVAMARAPSLEPLLTGGSPVDLVRFGALPLGSAELLTAEPWRLLSAVFVHVGLIHLALNATGLVYLGRILEPAVGPVRLVLVYVTTGIVGFAVSAAAALASEHHALTAGASGALFGMMGMVLGLLLGRRDRRWRLWLTQAVLFALAFGFAVGVANNAAHIGGLALGVGLGYAFGSRERRPVARWQRVGAALSLAACVLSLLLAQRSELWTLLESAAAQEAATEGDGHP